MEQLANQRILILGLGVSGRSAANSRAWEVRVPEQEREKLLKAMVLLSLLPVVGSQ